MNYLKIVLFGIMVWLATSNDKNSTLQEKIPLYLQELCPGTGVCLNDIIDAEDKALSCCGVCSCSVDCGVDGNCCFPNQNNNSYNHAMSTKHRYSECLYPESKPRKSAISSAVYQSYHMISSSEKDAEDNESPNMTVTCGNVMVAPWGSMYPVYSKKEGKIYKNRVCANAYGVTDGEEWSPYLSCSNRGSAYDGASFVSGLNSGFILDMCFLTFVYKGDISLLRSEVCYHAEDLISKCIPHLNFPIPPTTSASRGDIIASCESGLISPFKGKYANIFCFICKTSKALEALRCADRTDIRENGRASFTTILDAGQLSSLFNKDIVSVENTRIACLDRLGIQKKNTTASACRPISCPSGQMISPEQSCIYPGSIWIVDGFSMYLDLFSAEYINIASLERSLTDVKSPLPKTWIIDDIAYNAEMKTKFISVSQHITFRLPFNPKPFFKRLQMYMSKPWFLVSSNKTVKLQSKISKFKSFKYEPMYTSPVRKTIRLSSNTVVDMPTVTMLYFCDHVTLWPSEFSFLGNGAYEMLFNKITNTTLYNGEFTVVDSENGLVPEVCIETSGLFRISPNNSIAIFQSHHVFLEYLVILLIQFF